MNRRWAEVFGHVLRLAVQSDRRVALIIVGIVAAQAATVAVVSLAQRWMVDGTGLGITWGLVAAAVVGAFAHAANAAGNRIQINLRIDLSERVDLQLSREVLGMAAGIPTIEHFERPEYLDRLAILRKGARSLAASCWSAAEMAASFVSLGLSLWLLAAVHPALVLLAVLGVPPLLFARRSQRVVRAALDANSENMRREREVHNLCIQPASAKEVHISGSGGFLDALADRLWMQMSRREDRARVQGALWQLAGWACFGLGFAVAMILVTQMAITSAATLGDIVLVISLATRLRAQIELTVYSFNEVAEAGSVAEHYLWLRDYTRAQPDGARPAPQALRHGIELEDVSFSYPGTDSEVLRKINLKIPAGATLALVGINGAGKTTLVKLLTGMYEPTAGRIHVDKCPLPEMKRASWFAANSGVFQDFTKFELLTRETIGIGDLPRVEDREAVTVAVDRGGAATTVRCLPSGLDTQLGRIFDGAELSHGQWQKLALARGLMRDRPLLLVLDEPTAALDPQAEHDLFERFVATARVAAADSGAITVLVSHRFSTVHMADIIVVIEDGQVSEQGTHERLMGRNGRYADLYRLQAKAYA